MPGVKHVAMKYACIWYLMSKYEIRKLKIRLAGTAYEIGKEFEFHEHQNTVNSELFEYGKQIELENNLGSA